MDININISKTHVFAETFFKKKASKKSAPAGSLIFHFASSGLLVAFAEGSFEQPRVKSFLRLDTDPSRPDPDRAKALGDYLSSLNLKSTPNVLAVASDGVSLRQLTLPSMPDADLKQAALWELKKKFFVNPEEQLVGMVTAREFEGEEGPEKLVNVYYAEKKASLARLSIISGLGLPLHAFWPGSAALSRLASAQSGRDDGDLVVVDVAAAQARIVVVQKNLTMLSRSVPTGAVGSTLPETAYERLSEEIQKTIEFYETQKAARPIALILLAGGGYDAAALSSHLRTRFPSPVAAIDGARYVSDALTDEQRALLIGQPGLFAEPLGALSVQEETLNLIPDEIRAFNRRRRLDESVRKVFLGAAAAMAFWVAWVAVQGQFVAAQVGFVDKEWKEIQAGKVAFSEIVAKEKARRTAFKGALNLPSLLKELSRLTPSLIVVNSMRFSREEGTFKLSGVVNDIGRENVRLVTQYVDNLSHSPFFRSVTLGQTMEEGADGKVRFQIDAVIEPYA